MMTKTSVFTGNVQDILDAANHLQVVPVVAACSHYLRSQLDVDNCLDLLTIAETYTLPDLCQQIYCYMGQNLARLSCLPQYQRLSETQLKRLLKQNYPIECIEADVLQAVLSWIAFDLSARQQHAEALLSGIRYRYITKAEFQGIRQGTVFREICKRWSRVFSLVHCALLKAWSHCQHAAGVDRHGLVNPRGFDKAIVNIGGFRMERGITNNLSYRHVGSDKWRHLTTIPHIDQCDFGTAVVDNTLYVIGGCFNQSLQEHIHPFGFCYNPQRDKWGTTAPMLQERCRFYLGSIDKKLYAIGGVGEQDNFRVEHNCECYDIKTNSWYVVSPMPVNMTQQAGAVVGRNIYVCGGLDANDFVSSPLSCYNSVSDTWTQNPDMLTPRADHCMATHAGRLYVAGGWYDDAVSGARTIVDTVDCYNVHTQQWTTVTRMPTPRYQASMVIVNGVLYVIGGFTMGVSGRQASSKVEAYSIKRNRWEIESDFPTELWEHLSCVLYIPLRRADSYD